VQRIPIILILTFSTLSILSCESREETVSCFPHQQVGVQIFLNLPRFQPLQHPGGWVYLDDPGSGARGLIVIRTTTGFNVYDRNAPHLCPGPETTLEVKDDIKIICPQDGAEWMLLTGQPLKIAKIAPKRYNYTFDPASSTLTIVDY